MPKSKRDKKISLTKTQKKGVAFKQQIVEDIRSSVEKFKSIYAFTFENMRNEKMKSVRQEWKPSRFFFGKNSIIQIGLGRNKEEEVGDELHKLSKILKGQCALLFTDSSKAEVVEWFNNFSEDDIARSGFVATESITLSEGPITQFAHSIEPYLRQLGLPTKLERGIVTLIKEHEVCKKGAVLTPEQAKILELLGHRLATFRLKLTGCWIKDKGFEKIKQEKAVEASDGASEEASDSGDEMQED